ncbi:MAG: thioesterase family protein [Acidimicrobiia bacterium]|nr:thioesterase family protein [Acidimicrobiia bacterium]
MSGSALDQLVATVQVEAIGPDRFRGVGSHHDGVDATYGGHFLGQATSAALATVDDDRRLHSLHGYFLRAGRPGEPYVLEVERLRDGRSFCTRRVRVFQNQGKTQFELLASCARPEDGPQKAAAPPVDLDRLPRPEDLPNQRELMASLDPLPLPEDWALRDYGLDIRTVNAPWVPEGPSADGGIRLWVKAAGPLPADDHLQAAIMAYQSDESIADNIAIPWGATWGSPGVVFVSLDHSIWFHRPFDLNQWLFIDQRPITVGHGRGLATATVWNTDGELVVSFTQEALLRLGPDFLDDEVGP